ncbi:MAG: hypothetical protein ABIJ09_23035 [Pseudomonadota bacterium]
MQEVKIVGTFDSADTAAEVARALNAWFQWVMEANESDIPDLFEDFGLTSEEYALDRENDTDWEDSPLAEARGNHVLLYAYTSETQDMLQELLESLGAFEVEADSTSAD